jgi:hypothetical protein
MPFYFENFVIQMPPAISQTLRQPFVKIFLHPMDHLPRECCDFFLHSLL